MVDHASGRWSWPRQTGERPSFSRVSSSAPQFINNSALGNCSCSTRMREERFSRCDEEDNERRTS